MRRVVITGVGLIAPNANTFSAFAANLQNGIPGLREISYFDASTFPCRIVGQAPDLDRPGLQAQFPALQQVADPKVFLGVHAFQQLVRDFDPPLADCPINLGTSLEVFLIEKALRHSPHSFDPDRYLTAIANGLQHPYLELPLDFLGNFLKTTFKINGPNYVNCSACAAGTQAIGHAFQMIRTGRFDRVLTGGFDSMLNPLGLGGFARLGALATDNELGAQAMRPFDLRRKGTILGEGAAMLVLEELAAARQHQRPILAEIIGYGSTLDAYKPSEPDRSGAGIARAMQMALRDAQIDHSHIDYINAHGTGTIANDKAETLAIKQVFGESAYAIPVSSTKSMIGHLIGASGAVEIAAILAMFQNHFIAPTINLEKRDPACDLDYVPLRSRPQTLHYVMKNSMGFGGQNASLVLKRYP